MGKKRWDMSFNPSICQGLHITRTKCPIKTNYILHGPALVPTPNIWVLHSQITFIGPPHWFRLQEVKPNTRAPKRNIKVHNNDLKSIAYTTLVRPQLEYASTVWSPIQQQKLLNSKLYSARLPTGLHVTTSAHPVWHNCYRTSTGVLLNSGE